MTLETMPRITHEHCAFKIEALFQDGDWNGHLSVTEVELCEDYHSAERAQQASIDAQQDAEYPYDHEMWCEEQAELAAERAFRSTYETDLQYAEESFRVPGPFGY